MLPPTAHLLESCPKAGPWQLSGELDQTGRSSRSLLSTAPRLSLPLRARAVNQKDNDSCTALNYAARAKQLEACRVLIEFGADALQVDSECARACPRDSARPDRAAPHCAALRLCCSSHAAAPPD